MPEDEKSNLHRTTKTINSKNQPEHTHAAFVHDIRRSQGRSRSISTSDINKEYSLQMNNTVFVWFATL